MYLRKAQEEFEKSHRTAERLELSGLEARAKLGIKSAFTPSEVLESTVKNTAEWSWVCDRYREAFEALRQPFIEALNGTISLEAVREVEFPFVYPGDADERFVEEWIASWKEHWDAEHWRGRLEALREMASSERDY